MLDMSGWFASVSCLISCRFYKFEFWIGGNVDVSPVDFRKGYCWYEHRHYLPGRWANRRRPERKGTGVRVVVGRSVWRIRKEGARRFSFWWRQYQPRERQPILSGALEVKWFKSSEWSGGLGTTMICFCKLFIARVQGWLVDGGLWYFRRYRVNLE